MRRGLCSLIVLFGFLSLARADEAEERSAAYVKSIGGRVFRAQGKPNGPVVSVDFIWAKMNLLNLKEIAGLQQLKKLDLTNTGVSDAALADVAALKNLEELQLVNTKVTAAGLKPLASLKQLRVVSLHMKAIDDATLQTLRKIGILHLLSGMGSKFFTVQPKNAAEVTTVALLWSQVTDKGLKELADFPNVETVFLRIRRSPTRA